MITEVDSNITGANTTGVKTSVDKISIIIDNKGGDTGDDIKKTAIEEKEA